MAEPTTPERAHAKMYEFMLHSLIRNDVCARLRVQDVRQIAMDAACMCKRMFDNPDFWKDK